METTPQDCYFCRFVIEVTLEIYNQFLRANTAIFINLPSKYIV